MFPRFQFYSILPTGYQARFSFDSQFIIPGIQKDFIIPGQRRQVWLNYLQAFGFGLNLEAEIKTLLQNLSTFADLAERGCGLGKHFHQQHLLVTKMSEFRNKNLSIFSMFELWVFRWLNG